MIIIKKKDINKNILESQEKIIEPSTIVLKVQKQLNQIQITDMPLIEDGIYNEYTKQAIMVLQNITNYLPNGIIDQNLLFRLKEIIEHPIITGHNKNRTFAVLYSKYKANRISTNNENKVEDNIETCKVVLIEDKSYTIDFKGQNITIETNGLIDKELIPKFIDVKYEEDENSSELKIYPIYE